MCEVVVFMQKHPNAASLLRLLQSPGVLRASFPTPFLPEAPPLPPKCIAFYLSFLRHAQGARFEHLVALYWVGQKVQSVLRKNWNDVFGQLSVRFFPYIFSFSYTFYLFIFGSAGSSCCPGFL